MEDEMFHSTIDGELYDLTIDSEVSKLSIDSEEMCDLFTDSDTKSVSVKQSEMVPHGITVYGDIELNDVEAALKQYYPNKNIIVKLDSEWINNFDIFDSSNIVVSPKDLTNNSTTTLTSEKLIDNSTVNDNPKDFTDNIEIVVARYNEDLLWTLEYPFNNFKYTVYNKGINENFEKKYVNKVINLPNVGRVNHTILYHIAESYDSLKNITVFFPGSINLLNKKYTATYLLNLIKNDNGSNAYIICHYSKNIFNKFYNFKIDSHECSSSENLSINPDTTIGKSFLRPYYKWFLYNFGYIKPKFFLYRDIFSIHKDDVLKHPKRRYARIVSQMTRHHNPEVSHYVERSWAAIFYPLKHTKIIYTKNKDV
jgi:hypothetical protein